MTENKIRNANAIRSQQLITTALIELMNDKPFNEITIGDISCKGGLARRTFYAHFKTKEEVLEKYIDNIIEEYIDSFEKVDDYLDVTFAEVYFELWSSNIDFVLLLKKNNLLILLKGFEKYLKILNERYKIFDCFHMSEQEAEYAPMIYSGALWNMLDKWIDRGMKETHYELGELFTKLINWDV